MSTPSLRRATLLPPRRNCRWTSLGRASWLDGLAAVLFLVLALALGPEAHAQQVLGGTNLSNNPPPPSTGNDGQYYMDFGLGNVFGPKVSGIWPSPAIATIATSLNLPLLLGTLPVCTPNSQVAPVPTGQAFQCAGTILIAQ